MKTSASQPKNFLLMGLARQEAFTDYLITEERQSSRSIEEHLKNLGYIIKWATAQNFDAIERLNYTELLSYVQYEKERGMAVHSIKLRLNSLSKYYEYLKYLGILDKNPTKKIKLKGQLKSITQNVLSHTELEQLYNDYLKLNTISKHNKLSAFVKQKNNVLAGLLIWQGAVSSEIAKIKTEHINLDEATITLPKKGRGAWRELKLLPKQVLQFYQYINEARPQLQPDGEGLFYGRLADQCGAILKQFTGINQKIYSLSQIRASIIIHWIKVHGKRKAQYMAGHKYIGSTERFELQELDSLTDSLLKHHPFSK